ncbi:hypothetical protein M0R45_014786 [Rubus argutus]|uniref:Legume lectin domain-containing protein n=1 Tax=Rubus argutus TaxID=59490 RepID=A0AAW1XQ67_RUBAR
MLPSTAPSDSLKAPSTIRTKAWAEPPTANPSSSAKTPPENSLTSPPKFTFVIDSLGKTSYGDGLAFFIAPKGYQYPFVAVEFDIFQNQVTSVQDPAGDHVGIDVDSTKSLITKPWNGSVVNGAINSARVSYHSGSKTLSVAYTSYVNGAQVMRYLDYTVDLNQYLPDWVIVGFSAGTGALTAMHKINSWSFDSTSLVEDKF